MSIKYQINPLADFDYNLNYGGRYHEKVDNWQGRHLSTCRN